jgi:hypothetical protein
MRPSLRFSQWTCGASTRHWLAVPKPRPLRCLRDRGTPVSPTQCAPHPLPCLRDRGTPVPPHSATHKTFQSLTGTVSLAMHRTVPQPPTPTRAMPASSLTLAGASLTPTSAMPTSPLTPTGGNAGEFAHAHVGRGAGVPPAGAGLKRRRATQDTPPATRREVLARSGAVCGSGVPNATSGCLPSGSALGGWRQ